MNKKLEFSEEIRSALAPLYRLTNFHGLGAVASDYLVIVFAMGLFRWSPWLYPLSVLLIGSRQRALASVLHESCHRTLTRNRALNNFIGKWLAGLPIFQSHAAYQRSHVVDHHICLGDAARDPDYIHCIETGLTRVKSSREFWRQYVWKTALLGNVGNYLKYLLDHRLSQGRDWWGLPLVHACLFAVCYPFAGLWGYALLWLVPYFTSFQVIGWLSEISEHYRLYEKGNPLYMSRNRFPAPWERLFIGMHGDNYHLTHHLFAGIPFWNLRRAHGILNTLPEYRAVNSWRGGIVSSPPGRYSSLREIAADIDMRSLLTGLSISPDPAATPAESAGHAIPVAVVVPSAAALAPPGAETAHNAAAA